MVSEKDAGIARRCLKPVAYEKLVEHSRTPRNEERVTYRSIRGI